MTISALVTQIEAARTNGREPNIPLQTVLASVSDVLLPQMPSLQEKLTFVGEVDTRALIYLLATTEFYDDPLTALINLLGAIPLNKKSIVEFDFAEFYNEQIEAHKKRDANGTPHDPSYLVGIFDDLPETDFHSSTTYFG
jgi:hypothetical protein